jgi:PEP-CTERM motif
MSNLMQNVEPVAATPKKPSTGTKLIQAAALAAVLVPLGSVAMEAVTIDIQCVSGPSGFCNGGGSYASGGGTQSHTWGFYSDFAFTDLRFMLTISGEPTSDFTLFSDDVIVPVGPVLGLANYTCIPTNDEFTCAGFDVTALIEPPDTAVSWLDLFTMTITWFPNANPLSSDALNDSNTEIARAINFATFSEFLAESAFFPSPVPGEDPAISGKGDGFSRYFAVTNATVPEPATIILFGTGMASLMYRARLRRKRRP